MLWKGSPSTPLCTIAAGKIMANVLQRNNLPSSICTTLTGGAQIGETIARDARVPLVSFTGSTRVGNDFLFLLYSPVVVRKWIHVIKDKVSCDTNFKLVHLDDPDDCNGEKIATTIITNEKTRLVSLELNRTSSTGQLESTLFILQQISSSIDKFTNSQAC